MRRHSTGRLVFLVGLLAFGCVTTGGGGPADGPSSGDALVRVIGGGDFGFALRGNHVVGPKVDLTIERESIHGVLGGQLLRINVEGDKIYGSGPLGSITLSVETEGPNRVVRGVYANQKVRVRMGPDKIDGTVVRDWYLERTGDGVYRGGGAELKAAPAVISKLGDVRMATVMVLALANLASESMTDRFGRNPDIPGMPNPQIPTALPTPP